VHQSARLGRGLTGVLRKTRWAPWYGGASAFKWAVIDIVTYAGDGCLFQPEDNVTKEPQDHLSSIAGYSTRRECLSKYLIAYQVQVLCETIRGRYSAKVLALYRSKSNVEHIYVHKILLLNTQEQ
jgi:hypothetical protein